MKKLFDNIVYIEEQLSKYIENENLLAIIIECLISPYKAKIIFDDFYEKKNFIKEIFENENQKTKKTNPIKKEISLNNQIKTNDEIVTSQPYYENQKSIKNEELIKNIMTLNLLLIHPFYQSVDFNNDFINYLLKLNN